MENASPSAAPIKKIEETTQSVTVSPRVSQFRARIVQGYIIGAVVIFTILAVLARSIPYFAWDLRITKMFQSIRFPPLQFLMEAVSWIGYPPQAIIFTLLGLIFLWVGGLRWEATLGAASFAGSTALVQFLKLFIGRVRPDMNLVQVAQVITSHSFPSGHVVAYTVIFGYFWFLVFTLVQHSPLRTLLLIGLGALILLVGPSRVYQGEHWSSDVIAAYLLGSVWLLATITLYRLGKPHFFIDQPTAPPVL